MKPLLKRVGGFLLNLILTNKRETLPGQTITEVERTSALFGLNLNDFFKGLVMTVLGAVMGDIYASVEADSMVMDWESIKKGAIIAGIAYIMKQLGTPSKTILKLIIIGLLFSLPSFGQNNATIKALQSWNADSTTVRSLANMDSIMGRETGWLYFNNVTRKWRVGIATPDSVKWFDLNSNGGLTQVFANNGLHITGLDVVQLGGDLNGPTVINGQGYDLDFNNTGIFSVSGNAVVLADNLGTSSLSLSDNLIINTATDITIDAGGNTISFNNNAGSGLSSTGGITIIEGSEIDIPDLTGAGTRMVTATGGAGILGTQTIPSGISGLTAPRIPFAASGTTLTNVANMIWDVAGDRQVITNDAGSMATYTFGGQITLDEPSDSDNIVITTLAGGSPNIVIDEGSFTTTYRATDIIASDQLDINTNNGGSLGIAADGDLIEQGANITLSALGSGTLGIITLETDGIANINLNENNITILGNDLQLQGADVTLGSTASNIHIGTSGFVNNLSTDGLVYSSTYTPTLTNQTNITTSTSYACQFYRIGNVVTVSGKVDITPIATVITRLGISLPVASNFTASQQCGGTGSGLDGITAVNTGAILADGANDRATFEFIPATTGASTYNFSFTYQIL